MKIKNAWLCGCIAIFTFVACNHQKYETTTNGLQYRILEKGKGKRAVMGDILRLHLSYSNEIGAVIYDSKVLGDTFMIRLSEPTFKGGIEEGFALLNEGDSAEFIVSADSIFDKLFKAPMPPSVMKGEKLHFNVRFKKIVSVEEMNQFMPGASNPEAEEENRIQDYLIKNGLQVAPRKPGVYYVVFKEGAGDPPKEGDEITVRYTAKDMSGKVYDAPESNNGAITFKLGEGDFLPEWIAIVRGMKKGELSRLVLSSANAYGAKQSGPVPPNTPLVFDLEMVSIKRK